MRPRQKHPDRTVDPSSLNQGDRQADDMTPGVTPGAPGSEDAYARGGGVLGAGDVAGTESQSPSSGATPADMSPEAAPSRTGAQGPAAELEDQRDRYLRLAAEYDNFRKRSYRERQEGGARAQADIVKQIIDALEDLSRFAHVDPATTDAATVVQGVDMVERKLLKALTNAGLQVIDPVNQPFDPTLHEAVATEPALSREEDHVVARVYQPGYLFGGQLLRPARVVVKQWNG
jgi:molecular chaperone GrpE